MKAFLILFFVFFGGAAQAGADARVFKLFHTQEWAQASVLAKAYAQAHPQDAQAKFVHATALLYNGEHAQAKVVFAELLDKYPRITSLHNNMGVLLLAEGKVGEARKAFDTALKLDSRHAKARKNQALTVRLKAALPASRAFVDKRGIDFLGLGSADLDQWTPAVPERSDKASDARKSAVSSQGSPAAAAPTKEHVAVSQRENNPFNEDIKRQVFDALHAWVNAWADQDVDKYLSMYSPDFQVFGGKTRPEWEKQRRLRITNKKQIRIDAVDVVLEVGSPVAVVATFQQHYRSDVLHEISNKMLVFIRDSEQSSQWRIVDERTSY